MLTIVSAEDFDYSELTRTYMGIFYSQKFDEFLNTSQTGFAHTSAGIELSLLLKSLYTSLCFCIFQLTLFSFFRSIFKVLYQPRSYCVPINERMEPLPKGFFSWIAPTLKYSINYYLSMGLDTYFFVRYVSILLLFFVFVGSLNMIILIPINITGSSDDYSASGLDKLSLSNISTMKVNRLNSHFVMGLITIGFFHWLLLYEFQSFVKIRQSYLLSDNHKESVLSRTLLISNVPPYLQDTDVLNKVLDVVPGGIRNIWFLYDFKEIREDVQEAKEALYHLEYVHIKYLKRRLYSMLPIRLLWFWPFKPYVFRTGDMNEEGSKKSDVSKVSFYPPIYLKSAKIPKIERYIRIRLPGFFRILLLEKPVPVVDWCLRTLAAKHRSIDNNKMLLAADQIKKYNKVFVEFNTQVGAYIAHQCLLSQLQGSLDLTIIEIHPDDILWDNIARNNTMACLLEKYFVSLMFIAIILLYVVPVSFIGLVSQIPLLTKLIPSLGWIYKLPEEVRETISSLLPSILLATLTDIVLVVFRFLTYFKGNFTGSELEMDIQKWYFSFLFVQQFLVVTILSSITVIFKQIFDQPTSIPILLATNLPKAATFFFQFIALKAFSFCGNNFLRISSLVLYHTYYKLNDKTPRQKFNRVTNLLKIRWGSIYPVYSVFASVGLAYCIISPLIAIFVIFILSLLLLYYKYALRYIYSHINESDTKGRLYPVALLHLYTGVYCLECCLIGIFFLLKNDHGVCPMKIQGCIMCVVLLATIFGNITIYARFVKHFSYLPILSDKQYRNPEAVDMLKRRLKAEPEESNSSDNTKNDLYLNQNLLFLHPSFKYEYPKVWLPQDPFHISEYLINEIENQVDELTGGSTRGAIIDANNHRLKISITEAPPDYK